jgi:cobalt/nickel transport system ATP-binding protein
MSALLSLDGVTVLRSGRIILDRVSMALHAGERLALVGANGAGKTTLLRTLVGLQVPASGQVTAFGKRRSRESDFREVRAKAAYLFQDPDDQLFCPTVLEDVAFGPLNLGLSEKAAIAKARATLARLGLAEIADRVTHRLSGGEKRLVSLACVLAMDPDVLLLDEPTNALDENHLVRLEQVLNSLATAMVIVSHDRHLLERLARRAVLLKDGRLSPGTIHRHPHLHDHVHIHGGDAAADEGAEGHVHMPAAAR